MRVSTLATRNSEGGGPHSPLELTGVLEPHPRTSTSAEFSLQTLPPYTHPGPGHSAVVKASLTPGLGAGNPGHG